MKTDVLEWRSSLSIWRRELSFFLLSLRWADQVKRLSNIRLKYLTWGEWGMTEWYSDIDGHSPRCWEKVVGINKNFSIIFIFRLGNCTYRRYIWYFKCWLTIFETKLQASRAVSSAKAPIVMLYKDVKRM